MPKSSKMSVLGLHPDVVHEPLQLVGRNHVSRRFWQVGYQSRRFSARKRLCNITLTYQHDSCEAHVREWHTAGWIRSRHEISASQLFSRSAQRHRRCWSSKPQPRAWGSEREEVQCEQWTEGSTNGTAERPQSPALAAARWDRSMPAALLQQQWRRVMRH